MIEGVGHVPEEVRVRWDAKTQKPTVAVAYFSTAGAAGAVAAQLNGFEFTPGWPLRVRAVAAASAPSSKGAAKGCRGAGQGGGGGSSASTSKADCGQTADGFSTEYPVSNCVGAGRIEGWFASSSAQVSQRGWGHVQSFSFEGNLVFRLEHSALVRDSEFRQKDGVTFEVVEVAGSGGRYEAVHLALPGQEAEVPEPRLPGAPPWEPAAPAAASVHGGKEGRMKGKGAWAAAGPENSTKRRDKTWGNEDGLGVFFGGLNPEVTEERLQAFAQCVGTVTFAKLFVDGQTGTSRGCGKVFFAEPSMADRAITELSGTLLYGRPITVEILGQESDKKKRKKQSQQGPREDEPETEEGPKLLPLSYFSEDDTVEAKLDLCFAAFEDLLKTHDEAATGKGMVWMVRSLIKEVNDIFVDNSEAKQAFGARLRMHPWFAENQQIVRWQASRGRINISKMTPTTPLWKAWQQEKDKQESQGGTAQIQIQPWAYSGGSGGGGAGWAQQGPAVNLVVAARLHTARLQAAQQQQYGSWHAQP